MTQDMQNSATSVSNPYTPYRFFTDQDCLSGTPNSAPAGDCLATNIIHYQIKFNDVSSNGDSPVSAAVFPMCAIQPIVN
jgi:hypothetical protein